MELIAAAAFIASLVPHLLQRFCFFKKIPAEMVLY
jgi:hypothetical protein